jgi:hypothetical protein
LIRRELTRHDPTKEAVGRGHCSIWSSTRRTVDRSERTKEARSSRSL